MSEVGQKVTAMHREGLAALEIAHRLNVAESTVRHHLRALDRPPPPSNPVSTRPKSDTRSEVRTRDQVLELLNQGLTRIDVARRLGVSQSTVSYHARRVGATIDERCRRRYDWNAIQAFYDEGHTVRECRAAFGFSSQTWHAAALRGAVLPRPRRWPLDEVFRNGTDRNRGHLKARLILAGLKTGSCEGCGISDWLGAPLTIALHHVNGDRRDNRVENLALLCPNCHSQTPNFAGRANRPGSDHEHIAPNCESWLTASSETVSRPGASDRVDVRR